MSGSAHLDTADQIAVPQRYSAASDGRAPPAAPRASARSVSVQRLLVIRSAPICPDNQPSPIRKVNKIAYDESVSSINLLKRD